MPVHRHDQVHVPQERNELLAPRACHPVGCKVAGGGERLPEAQHRGATGVGGCGSQLGCATLETTVQGEDAQPRA
jgi:hypothetical protein